MQECPRREHRGLTPERSDGGVDMHEHGRSAARHQLRGGDMNNQIIAILLSRCSDEIIEIYMIFTFARRLGLGDENARPIV